MIFRKSAYDIAVDKIQSGNSDISFANIGLDKPKVNKLLRAMLNNDNIKSVDFNNCQMSDDCAVMLFNGLLLTPSILNIQRANFDKNRISELSSIAIHNFLLRAKSLKDISFEENNLNDDACFYIASILPKTNLEKISYKNNVITNKCVREYIKNISEKHTTLEEASFYSFMPEVSADAISKATYKELGIAIKNKAAYVEKRRRMQKVRDINSVNIKNISQRISGR